MKVNYLPRNNFKNSYLKPVLILLLVFILGAIFLYFLKGNIISLVSPIWKAKNVVVSGENLTPIVDRETSSGLIVATVLTYPPQTPYDVIIIDAGSGDSVSVGNEVYLPEGPIIGRISEVFPKNSKVKLFSSSGEKTGAILERNNVPVILVGQGGGNFKVELPRDIGVEVGDRILSPDISSGLLAVVGEISSEPTDSFKQVLAQGSSNIFMLRFVFIRK